MTGPEHLSYFPLFLSAPDDLNQSDRFCLCRLKTKSCRLSKPKSLSQPTTYSLTNSSSCTASFSLLHLCSDLRTRPTFLSCYPSYLYVYPFGNFSATDFASLPLSRQRSVFLTRSGDVVPSFLFDCRSRTYRHVSFNCFLESCGSLPSLQFSWRSPRRPSLPPAGSGSPSALRKLMVPANSPPITRPISTSSRARARSCVAMTPVTVTLLNRSFLRPRARDSKLSWAFGQYLWPPSSRHRRRSYPIPF